MKHAFQFIVTLFMIVQAFWNLGTYGKVNRLEQEQSKRWNALQERHNDFKTNKVWYSTNTFSSYSHAKDVEGPVIISLPVWGQKL